MNIDKLIKIESSICNFSNYLYELELYDSKDSIYDDFVRLYDLAVKDERKYFISLSYIEYNELVKYFNDEINKKKYNNNIVNRILRKLKAYEKKEIVTINFNGIDVNDDIFNAEKSVNFMEKAIIKEKDDIYLSFLDEYINKVNDINIKKDLLKEKYNFITNLEEIHEDELIKRKFKTDKEIYLTSEMSYGFNDTDYQIYKILRATIASNYLKKIDIESKLLESKLICNNKSNIMLFFLKLRTSFLLLDNDVFNNVVNEFKDVIGNFDVFDILCGENFEKNIYDDRKRHKTLSFRRK